MTKIRGLHHNAYRCRDSEETRVFYEEFLGLPLVSAFEIDEGRALHTFFQMADGSCLAFFEAPGKPFEFKRQDTLDLHIALGVDDDVFDAMLAKRRRKGRRCAARSTMALSARPISATRTDTSSS
jgi:catechol 2,3-dioxygenase-like lactoylglutathione lyase family enzyme